MPPAALLSLLNTCADKSRLTAVVANELEIMDGKLTGNVIGDIVDAQYKAKTLTRLAQEYEIPLAQTVAIGDGANDRR